MRLKLGIIGSDNSHSHSIAEVANRLKKVPLRVTHLWGESPESARDSAEKGDIPHIVSDWREMLGKVDGVMIDHRDGAEHYEAARFFIENRVPTFVDKPLTCDLAQARELLSLAARKKTPVCSFSLIPIQSAFRKFVSKIRRAGFVQTVLTTGPADIEGPYGGIFFYGFHQVDAVVEMLGVEAEDVLLQRQGNNGVGTIRFSGGRVAVVNFLKEHGQFFWVASTAKGVISLPNQFDPVVYLPSVRVLHQFIRTGKAPWERERMLTPLAILEAMQKSLKSGKVEKVSPVK